MLFNINSDVAKSRELGGDQLVQGHSQTQKPLTKSRVLEDSPDETNYFSSVFMDIRF